jgi:hypothetical protein
MPKSAEVDAASAAAIVHALGAALPAYVEELRDAQDLRSAETLRIVVLDEDAAGGSFTKAARRIPYVQHHVRQAGRLVAYAHFRIDDTGTHLMLVAGPSQYTKALDVALRRLDEPPATASGAEAFVLEVPSRGFTGILVADPTLEFVAIVAGGTVPGAPGDLVSGDVLWAAIAAAPVLAGLRD